MWGFSPSLDLLHESGYTSSTVDDSPINILLMNACDVRHILKTLSHRRRHSSLSTRPIHFYLLDNPVEVLARHMLLLHVITDWEIPIRQRAILFLEIFGNSLVTDRTARYIESAGADLVRLVCDQPSALSDIVNLSHLKFRDRDAMESAFKSWKTAEAFDVVGLRDTRLRHYYGDRYDAKKNVLDWDYQTRIKPNDSIIHIKQYREWRDTGIAFEFGDSTYNQPNRSMSSYTPGFMKHGKDKGMKKDVRGFWLDIVVSPYPAFGVEAEPVNKFAEDLFLILNKGTGTAQNRHHTVEVSTYNLMSYLWEIETGAVYMMTKKEDIFSGLGEDASDFVVYTKAVDAVKKPAVDENGEEVAVREEDAAASAAVDEEKKKAEEEARQERAERMEKKRLRQAASRARNIIETLDNVQVMPLSGSVSDMYNKQKYEGFFDIVYASQHGCHNVKDDQFATLLKPDCKLVVESGRHVYAVGEKKLPELNDLILDVASKGGWKLENGHVEDKDGLLPLTNLVFGREQAAA
jgi:dynein assembly factor 3